MPEQALAYCCSCWYYNCGHGILGSCGVRFNPGLGSGGTEKTNVGGPAASFGVWHEEKEHVQAIAAKHGVTIKRIHTHIGSGSDPRVWIKAASLSLALVEFFDTVTIFNLGIYDMNILL
jgi:diaminopimelate decarboxylase